MDYPVIIEPGSSEVFITSQSGGTADALTINLNRMIAELLDKVGPNAQIIGWDLAGGGESDWLVATTVSKDIISPDPNNSIAVGQAFAFAWEVGAAQPDAQQGAQWLAASLGGNALPPTPADGNFILSTGAFWQSAFLEVLDAIIPFDFEVVYYGHKVAGTFGPRFVYCAFMETVVFFPPAAALDANVIAKMEQGIAKLAHPAQRALGAAVVRRIQRDAKLPAAERAILRAPRKAAKKEPAKD